MSRIKVWVRENNNGQMELINIDMDNRKKLSLKSVDGKNYLSFVSASDVCIENGQEIYFEGINEPWSFDKFEDTSKHSRWLAIHPRFKKKIIKMNCEYVLAMTLESVESGILHNVKKAESKFEYLLKLYEDFVKFRVFLGSDVNKDYECHFYDGDNFKRECRCYSNGEEFKYLDENNRVVKRINKATVVISVSEQFDRMYRLVINVNSKDKDELNANKNLIKEVLLNTKALKDVMGDDFDDLVEEIQYTTF